ncbi:MAG: hypothetical protein WAT66_07800 [Actinomycetota bacterium]
MLRRSPAIGPVPLLGVTLLGAALGTAWDSLHVWTGTTAYAFGPDRMPFWVPLEFGFVYLIGAVGIALIGSPRPDERSRSRLLVETVWLTAVYATTALLHRYEWLVVALAVAAIVARRRAFVEIVRANPAPAIALITGGTIVETVLIALGVFDYSVASLGNVPVWLPLLYANAIPFAVRLTETALWYSRVTERPVA